MNIRRTYISPENNYIGKKGTFSESLSKTTMFSVCPTYPSEIILSDESLSWTVAADGSIVPAEGAGTAPVTWNTIENKSKYHTIGVLDEQNATPGYPKWNIVVDARKLFIEYVCAKMKSSGAFDNIRPTDIPQNSVDSYVFDFVGGQVVDLYTLSGAEVTVSPLSEGLVGTAVLSANAADKTAGAILNKNPSGTANIIFPQPYDATKFSIYYNFTLIWQKK